MSDVEPDFESGVTALELVVKAARTNPKGTVPCPKCGGTIHYVHNGPRALRANCDGCKLEFMS